MKTRTLLLAAGIDRAIHAATFWLHAEKDRSVATAKRIANQEGARIERPEVIQSDRVSTARRAQER